MYVVHFSRVINGRKQFKYSLSLDTYTAAERRARREVRKYPEVKAVILAAIAEVIAEVPEPDIRVKWL